MYYDRSPRLQPTHYPRTNWRTPPMAARAAVDGVEHHGFEAGQRAHRERYAQDLARLPEQQRRVRRFASLLRQHAHAARVAHAYAVAGRTR